MDAVDRCLELEPTLHRFLPPVELVVLQALDPRPLQLVTSD